MTLPTASEPDTAADGGHHHLRKPAGQHSAGLCAQAVGIDLPMKALVWVDAQPQVWLGYNDPVWMVRRHPDCRWRASANRRHQFE